MIRVRDLETSIAFYQAALGLEIKEQFIFDEFTLTYLGNQTTDFELELTYNHDTDNDYSHGSGYGHIAVSVEDIEESFHGLTLLDMKPTNIKHLNHKNTHLASFFFIQDPDGYKIEFLQRSKRYR
ncbi:VOC family protein [Shewanella sp. NR704-98]|uniref:Aldoketomutase n=2 Tax=Shewanella nanhaiensis TaxID=2864872 RepID=A0ABS7E7N0_9GAMM|nr:VOC family protein [Shewanella nanhaiensis]MBW8185560.1 VOC family protein [Shewanella nanhaiensis]